MHLQLTRKGKQEYVSVTDKGAISLQMLLTCSRRKRTGWRRWRNICRKHVETIDWEVGKILAGKLEETFEQKNQEADWKTEKKEMRAQDHFPKLGRPSDATSYSILLYSRCVYYSAFEISYILGPQQCTVVHNKTMVNCSFLCPHSAALGEWRSLCRSCGKHGSCSQPMLLPASFNIRAHYSGTPVLEGMWEDTGWLSLNCSFNWVSPMRHRLTKSSAGICSHWRQLGCLHHHR